MHPSVLRTLSPARQLRVAAGSAVKPDALRAAPAAPQHYDATAPWSCHQNLKNGIATCLDGIATSLPKKGIPTSLVPPGGSGSSSRSLTQLR
mmetsp:Transcript_5225/g.8407  ORF Transcript_5225/g.8407 Transcript_5225/m.8407 type:complete len:92 (-) Transcript_5225:425-700(-)